MPPDKPQNVVYRSIRADAIHTRYNAHDSPKGNIRYLARVVPLNVISAVPFHAQEICDFFLDEDLKSLTLSIKALFRIANGSEELLTLRRSVEGFESGLILAELGDDNLGQMMQFLKSLDSENIKRYFLFVEKKD